MVAARRRCRNRGWGDGDGGGAGHGANLLERQLAIGLRHNAAVLGERLSQITAELMVDAMPLIEAAGVGPAAERLKRLGVREQNSETVYARMLSKAIFRSTGMPAPFRFTARDGAVPRSPDQLARQEAEDPDSEPLIERLRVN